MKIIAMLVRGGFRRLAVALACSVLSGAGSAWLVALINESLTADARELRELGAAFVALMVAMPLLRWLSQAQFAVLQQDALAKLRELVSRRIADMPYAQLEGRGAASLFAVLVEDVATVSEVFVALPRFAMQAAIVLGGFGYLAWLSPSAFAIVMLLVVLGSLTHFAAVRRASDSLERARDAEDELYEHFRGLVAGAKELRLNAARRDGFLRERLATSLERVRELRTRGLLTYVGAGSWGSFMFFVVIGCVIFGLAPWLGLSAAARSGYALIFLYIMFPLEDLLESVPDLVRARIASEGIEEACGEALLRGPAPVLPEARAIERVALDGVRHRYRRDNEDGAFELGPIDFGLTPGEVVFLVGGNGSGKTTLAKLLTGLYEPEAGALRLDERVIDDDARAAYRQRFAAVFSDFHVFDGLYGLDSALVAAHAEKYLSWLGLSGVVQIENGKLSTTELSSGQRKRLALLVALLEDRPVYVFDEWAADQDPAYKELFYGPVLRELAQRGKAVLVVTHDDRYFDRADRTVVLESGQIRGPALALA